MAKVELKQPVVQAIAEDVKDAVSVVLVDYRGLTVAEDTEIREFLSLLFSLPSNAFLHALKQMGKIAEQQQKTESQR